MISESSLRRRARAQGLRLEKSRARNPRDIGYGTYHLVDVSTNMVVEGMPDGFGLSLDVVAGKLFG
jgi:hypothetical protein